jgi:hypothetical protein
MGFAVGPGADEASGDEVADFPRCGPEKETTLVLLLLKMAGTEMKVTQLATTPGIAKRSKTKRGERGRGSFCSFCTISLSK